MANKTIQALKITAAVVLTPAARGTLTKALFAKTPAEAVTLVGARVKINHAIATNYDQPDHAARVATRIAEIKAAIGKLGTIEQWNIVAGAAPVEEVETLPDLPVAAAE